MHFSLSGQLAWLFWHAAGLRSRQLLPPLTSMHPRLWRSTLRPHAVYMRQPPDQISPYHQIDGFSLHTLMSDVLHVFHLGIGQDLGASCLCWLLASGYLAQQQSPEEHLADLGLELRAWCCAKGLRPPPRRSCGHASIAGIARVPGYRGLSAARVAAWQVLCGLHKCIEQECASRCSHIALSRRCFSLQMMQKASLGDAAFPCFASYVKASHVTARGYPCMHAVRRMFLRQRSHAQRSSPHRGSGIDMRTLSTHSCRQPCHHLLWHGCLRSVVRITPWPAVRLVSLPPPFR